LIGYWFLIIVAIGSFVLGIIVAMLLRPRKEQKKICENQPRMPDDKFLALQEYKLAVELYRDQNRLTWDKFKIFFAINSALLAAIGYLKHPLTLGVAFLGVFACIVWWQISDKNAAYSEYWIQRANQVGDNLKFDLLSEERYKKARREISGMKIDASNTILLIPYAFLILWVLSFAAQATCLILRFCWGVRC